MWKRKREREGERERARDIKCEGERHMRHAEVYFA